jgi:hypothetical protein
MTDLRFKAAYSVADGYVGKERPLYFSISAGELEEDMDDEDLVDLFEDSMQAHFEQSVHPESSDRDAFIVWARHQLSNRSGKDLSND